MDVKFLEIRDRATFISVMAIKTVGEMPEEQYYLRKAGYGHDSEYIMVIRLEDLTGHYDRFQWGKGSRTMFEAHAYIQDNFDILQSGDVIDVEYIKNDTQTKKVSERFDR